ncbi:PLIN3 protein, partial [Penelope pileata]|nr:PLIN3 protein [Penelope pileata]
ARCLQAEARMLVVLRGLLGQLRAACTHLAARGLPGTVQGVQGVHTPLVRARSLHELSDTVLAQSRKKALQAQESIEEMLEYVGQHAALPWIVGPFAPALVECPDDSQVQMAKWEGCVTVGHGEHGCPQWGAQHQGLGGPAWDS